MYHVAFINITDKKIIMAESFNDIRDAQYRIDMGYKPQVELEMAGLGSYGGPDHKYVIYGPMDKAFEWSMPVEPAPE